MLFFLLPTICLGERLFNPETKTLTHELEDIRLKVPVGKTHIFHFDNNNIYDMETFKETDGKFESMQEPQELRNVAVTENNINGCFPFRRRLIFKKTIILHLYKDTYKNYFTDLLILDHLKEIYLITDQYMIHKVKLKYDNGLINKVQYIKADSFNLLHAIQNLTSEQVYPDNPKLLHKNYVSKLSVKENLQDILYVFTPYGIAQLETEYLSPLKLTNFYSTSRRKHIYDVQMIENLAIVAAGTEGIDIYSLSQNEIVLQATLGSSHFDQGLTIDRNQPLNVIDVGYDESSGYLIALDANSGLYFFDLVNQTLVFQITFPRTIAFDHYNNTYMIIAETVNGIEYVAELFIDTQKQSYFFNRIYMEDTEFKHIEMTENFAFVISSDDHVVIQHSIYNEFVPKPEEIVSYFTEANLVRFEYLHQVPAYLQTPNQIKSYYVGLSQGNLIIVKAFDESPGVICRLSESSEEGEQTFKVIANATNCQKSDFNITQNRYSQCQITRKFVLNAQKPLIESDNRLAAWAIALIVIFTFFTIGIIVCYSYIRWRKQIQHLKHQLSEHKKYSALQDAESSSIMMKDKQQE